MKHLCKAISRPTARGETIGRLEALTPFDGPDGFRIMARFAVVGGKSAGQSVIALVTTKEFRKLAKCLSEKGACKKSSPVDGEKLIGRLVHLNTIGEIRAVEDRLMREDPEYRARELAAIVEAQGRRLAELEERDAPSPVSAAPMPAPVGSLLDRSRRFEGLISEARRSSREAVEAAVRQAAEQEKADRGPA